MSLIGGGIVAPDMKDPIVIMGDIRFLQEVCFSLFNLHVFSLISKLDLF